MTTTTHRAADVPTEHVLTALHALLDHISQYRLPIPQYIDPSMVMADRIIVAVYAADQPAWLATLHVDDERVTATSKDSGEYVVSESDARVPLYGIRIQLRSAIRVAVAS